jgi:hypothetical protein
MRYLELLALLALTGCVSTTVTTPEGLTIERTAFYSDFTVRAARSADGTMMVEETQAGGDEATQALLDLLMRPRP